MKKIQKKYIFIPLGLVLILAILSYGTLQLMNARTFQLFGGLVSHVDTDQKVVALTFDDAPGPPVDEVSNILAQKQVKATFYEIGQQIEKYPTTNHAICLCSVHSANKVCF